MERQKDVIAVVVRAVALAASFACASCAVPPTSARLYPENEAAAKTGVLEAKLSPADASNGRIDVSMPDGEILKGEYTVVREGASGFGTIFGSVYSPGASAFGSALSTNTITRNANKGIASAFGSAGTRATCEFLHDGTTGRGYGACQLSTGATYRLQY